MKTFTKKIVPVIAISCQFCFGINVSRAQSWIQKSNMGTGNERWRAAGFSIDGKGYIGTGQGNSKFFRDLWEYDPSADTWTQKADFGADPFDDVRHAAVGFSIGSKGYIGTGQNFWGDEMRDFWQYDPISNVWIRKSDLPGNARHYAVGFSIGDKGYIGTGLDMYCCGLDDLWEYNPVSDVWTKKANFPPGDRRGAAGFSISGKGYIGTGFDGVFATWAKDFWEYDPVANSWTRKADFSGLGRNLAIGFSIGTRGYIGLGNDNSTPYAKDFWEYNPAANAWTKKPDFGGTGRISAVGFSIGNCGYVGTGSAGSYTRDLWSYCPIAQPVELVSFSAAYRNGDVILNWTTASETDNLGFEPQCSGDGTHFESIGFVQVNHSSGEKLIYEFTDTEDKTSVVYYYRLRQVDENGNFSYSKKVEVYIPISHEFTVGEVFQNPSAVNYFSISFAAEENTNILLTVTDMTGKICLDREVNIPAGGFSVNIPANGLSAGMYILTVKSANETHVRKFMKK